MMKTSKPTKRDAALASIERARAEVNRPDHGSALVIDALLREAYRAVEEIEELVRARRKKAATASGAEIIPR